MFIAVSHPLGFKKEDENTRYSFRRLPDGQWNRKVFYRKDSCEQHDESFWFSSDSSGSNFDAAFFSRLGSSYHASPQAFHAAAMISINFECSKYKCNLFETIQLR